KSPGSTIFWRWCSTKGNSIEHHYRADRLSVPQLGEALVDIREPDALRDQLIQHQPAIEIGLGQHRKVARRAGAAVARAPDALLLHQRAPAERNVVSDVDLAEPHHLAAGSHRF